MPADQDARRTLRDASTTAVSATARDRVPRRVDALARQSVRPSTRPCCRPVRAPSRAAWRSAAAVIAVPKTTNALSAVQQADAGAHCRGDDRGDPLERATAPNTMPAHFTPPAIRAKNDTTSRTIATSATAHGADAVDALPDAARVARPVLAPTAHFVLDVAALDEVQDPEVPRTRWRLPATSTSRQIRPARTR